MNRIDFDSINASLDPASVVPQWLPDGKRVGGEWVARNPTRNDSHAGSFTINLGSGQWGDFATDEKGGDLVSLYAYLFHSGDNGKAARELADNRGIDIGNPEIRQRTLEKVAKIEEARPKIIMPIPADVPAPDFNHFNHGDPSAVWTYRAEDGRPLLYICRFDHDGKKEIIPRSWCDHPGKGARWTWRGITGTARRPLYGLEKLADRPYADVVLVEGEKTADAAQQLMGDEFIVMAWAGGTSTAELVELRGLRNRRVVLWPDFDSQTYKEDHELAGQRIPKHLQPGVKAMVKIAERLAGVAREVLMVDYDIEHPKLSGGWDLADAVQQGWKQTNMMEYMGLHSGNPFHVAADRMATEHEDQLALAELDEAEQDGAPAPAPAPAKQYLSIDHNANPMSFPHLSDKGAPLNTVENLACMLDQYGITCRYNEVSKDVEVTIPDRRYSRDNAGNCSMAELISLCSRNRMPRSDLDGFVKLIADGHCFNPVRDWIESVPWDGRSRLADIGGTITSDIDPNLKLALIYRWMVSAVAAIYKPRGFSAHGVLVFTGEQGKGKTAWIKSLVPDELNAFLEGAMIDPANKDTVIQAVGHWIVELGELDATFRKADVARLKAFVTQTVDKVRQPYDRRASEYQRRTVFFASVNEDRYLVDDTGNRRWWTVPVQAVDYQHSIDVQQLWAEVLDHYHKGAQWWLTPDEQEMLNEVNAEHESVDPVEEMLRKVFDWDRPGLGQDMTASEALIAIGFDKPNRAASTHASKILQKMTGGKPRKGSQGRRVFRMPHKTILTNH